MYTIFILLNKVKVIRWGRKLLPIQLVFYVVKNKYDYINNYVSGIYNSNYLHLCFSYVENYIDEIYDNVRKYFLPQQRSHSLHFFYSFLPFGSGFRLGQDASTCIEAHGF